MMSHKVLIYVALVVLIVQVAVTSAGGNHDCKCTEFDGKGNCVQNSCPCPPGKKCTPPKARNQAGKASPAGSKPGAAMRTPLAPKNTNTQQSKGNGRATRKV